MKLYGHPDSGHAFKVRFFMRASGIEHDYERVDIFAPLESRSEDFRRHARFGEVPTLVDDGRAYVQSDAILVHLATKLGAWGVEDPGLKSQCLEWLFWEANKIGMCLPQLRGHERFDSMQLSSGAYQWLRARYDHDIAVLERAFADKRHYILGEQASIADFALCGYLVLVDEAKLAVPKYVAAWLERMRRLPGWQHPYDMMSDRA